MYMNNTINRILQYRNCIVYFKTLGFQKIFAMNLAIEIGVSAEQVRKDFSLLGVKGNKKGGYEIDSLHSTLNVILQKEKVENVIVVGTGNIGKALIQYKGFSYDNINVVAAFDIDPSKQKKSEAVPVYGLERLKEVINKKNVKIAVVSVPAIVVQDVCNQLVLHGIKGIINFAPIVLKVPEGVIVNNINLTGEINNLIYFINNIDTLK